MIPLLGGGRLRVLMLMLIRSSAEASLRWFRAVRSFLVLSMPAELSPFLLTCPRHDTVIAAAPNRF